MQTHAQGGDAGTPTPPPLSTKFALLPVRQRPWMAWGGALLLLLVFLILLVTGPLARGLLARLSVHDDPISPPAQQAATVSHLSFEREEQDTAVGSRGIANGLLLDLVGMLASGGGMSYYGWLLADRRPEPHMSAPTLGEPPRSGGRYVFYAARRTFIPCVGSFLITQEAAGVRQCQPARDQATWGSRAGFPQVSARGEQAYRFSAQREGGS